MNLISNETLYLYFDGSETILKNRTNEYRGRGNLVKAILNQSCIYYGSSLDGRIKGTKGILNCKYKLPVIISEKNQIVLFPVKSDLGLIWFNFKNIKGFEKYGDKVKIEFNNSTVKEFEISYAIFNNQMLKCSRLWLVYLSRC